MSGDKTATGILPANADLWRRMRERTVARIGLDRSGGSPATGPLLDFRLAHARARDAVHAELDVARLAGDLGRLDLPVLTLTSAAADRKSFLMRPDLGRMLTPEAETGLAAHAAAYDAVFVISDGLSAHAVQNHAEAMLVHAIPVLRAEGWRIAPVVIVRHGRVAVGDRVAGLLGATSVVTLIGERPGLSSPDSMGAYVTWRPDPRTTDAGRNCISNIHPGGITYADAAFKLVHLMRAMRTRRISGVRLKDESVRLAVSGENRQPPQP